MSCSDKDVDALFAALPPKRERSMERAARKQDAARRIPHLGVRVSRKIVESQRYLRDHGLPHSAAIAAVPLPADGRVPYRMAV